MKRINRLWLSTMLLVGCVTHETQLLPELTYFGEEPRIQNPLSPEDSQKHIQLPKGFTAELYAAEPNIINPIAMTWDERGRLWVVQSQDYPHELENDVGGDRITICEDTDGDGRADKFTDFATQQSLTTGITIVKGGAIVAQAPDMVFLQDTDGDDVADNRKVLFGGFGIWDTHAGPSNLHYGIDNQIWGAVGYSGFERVFQGETVSFTRGVYRFARDGSTFEPIGQFNNNTWGCGITADNEIFGSTANNNHACYIGIPLRHYDYLGKRPSWAIDADFIQGHYEITAVDTVPLQQVDVRGGYTAAAGANFYTATNYPKAYRNQMYVNAPTGHLVHLARIEEDGAGYQEVDGGNIFASTDAWTAPVCTETGPDGNLWVADWYNPVIQHNPDARGMPNQIWNDDRGPGNAHLNDHRDERHGRIYIIKYRQKSDQSIASLDPSEAGSLLRGLIHDNMFWRVTAQRLIVENYSGDATMISHLSDLALSKTNAIGGMHALWALDGVGDIPESVLEKVLESRLPAVRKAAIALLPESERGSDLLVNAGVLSDDDLYVRRNAALRASELPETSDLYAAMENFAGNDQNRSDKWLSAAARVYFREQNREDVDARDVEMLIASGAEGGANWKYVVEEPVAGWMAPDFNDESWAEAQGDFGSQADRKTSWTSDDIWLRKTFDLDADVEEPVLKIMHDDDARLYINGRLVWERNGHTHGEYELIRLSTDGIILRQGRNTIAVQCHNGGGNQYLDLGIGRVAKFSADRTIVLNCVPSQMAYDRTLVHATAGENLEIVLNNTDAMQHNLVVVEPGSEDAFGKIVDQFARDPKATELDYVPRTRYVIASTSMLDPGESEVLQFKVPEKAGDYPYICTFPAHRTMMKGVLKVTGPATFVSDNTTAPKIASMGGGSSHNFLRFFGGIDGRILYQQGKYSVHYTEDSDELTDLIVDADLLRLTNNKVLSEATQQAIFHHVDGGKPLMIDHPSAWYNWEDWPEYNRQLVAGGSRSHEALQEFEVSVRRPDHPVMQGLPPSFRIVDELYRFEHDARGPGIEVLAVGRGLVSGEEFPVVVVVKHRRARILVNTLGHDARAHGHQAYQKILTNGTNWLLGRQSAL